jgi:hypothetical protein
VSHTSKIKTEASRFFIQKLTALLHDPSTTPDQRARALSEEQLQETGFSEQCGKLNILYNSGIPHVQVWSKS